MWASKGRRAAILRFHSGTRVTIVGKFNHGVRPNVGWQWPQGGNPEIPLRHQSNYIVAHYKMPRVTGQK